MEYMATLDELRKIRLKKLTAIEKAGILAYPEKTRRTHKISQALADFTSLMRSKKEAVLVGRIMSLREHGGSTFLNVQDGTGTIQAYFKKDRIGEKGYRFFLDNFDIGDFMEIRGIFFKTKKGEKTLEVADFKMLAKSLLPLPEKWHGLQDVEERFRKRYLDLIFNKEIKEKFVLRSGIIKELRDFMEKEGFLEVETPILQPVYGGATALPFKTHLNALDMDLYLRIAPELYLKRLLIGGFEKVFEIGRVFRNEGMDRSHNPDYTHFEFYQAFADYKELMKFCEKMMETIIKKIFGKLEIEYEGKKINFKTPWPRIEFEELLKKETKINFEEINAEALKAEAEKLGAEIPEGAGKSKIADEIYKKVCRQKIWQPSFIINYPSGFQPLAKSQEGNPGKLCNFQLVIGGWELANAFSELNDPIEQMKRFQEQEKLFKTGLQEAQRIDQDYIEAMEYGLPPAAGFGMGIDRFVALLTDSHSLREIILFPAMRKREK
jgi:lysyl-tRNA synthetase class 2